MTNQDDRTIIHGTTGGYYRHRRFGEDPCRACKDAVNLYIKEWREQPHVQRNKDRETARRKAMAMLRLRYAEEYQQLVDDFYEMGMS